jgi:hypothetical protein
MPTFCIQPRLGTYSYGWRLVKVYTPRWTDAIQDEWIRNVLGNRPHVERSRLLRTRQKMDQIDPMCLVTGYEALIPGLALPDSGDRHVLAAAIHSGASVVVTYNLKDFPGAIMERYGVGALHPDAFLCRLLDDDPTAFIRAVVAHRAGLKAPPKPVSAYLDTLRAQNLPKLVEHLRPYAASL